MLPISLYALRFVGVYRRKSLYIVIFALCIMLGTAGCSDTRSSNPDQQSVSTMISIGTPNETPTSAPVSAGIPSQMPPNVTVVMLDGLEPAPVVGVVVDGNMSIVHVEPQSNAEKAGLSIGDTLLAVNEIAIENNSRIAKAVVQGTLPNEAVVFQVRRNGRIVDISVIMRPLSNGSTVVPLPSDAPVVDIVETPGIYPAPKKETPASIAPTDSDSAPFIPQLPTSTPVLPPFDYF